MHAFRAVFRIKNMRLIGRMTQKLTHEQNGLKPKVQTALDANDNISSSKTVASIVILQDSNTIR